MWSLRTVPRRGLVNRTLARLQRWARARFTWNWLARNVAERRSNGETSIAQQSYNFICFHENLLIRQAWLRERLSGTGVQNKSK